MRKIHKIDVRDLITTFIYPEDVYEFLVERLKREIANAKVEIAYFQDFIDTLEPGYKYQKPEYTAKIRAFKKTLEFNTQALKLLEQSIKFSDKADSVYP